MMNIDYIRNIYPPLQPLVRVFLERLRFKILHNRVLLTGFITDGYRTSQQQASLYAIGRTSERGRKPVTYAQAGDSLHEYGLAIDICFRVKQLRVPNPDPPEISYDLLSLFKAGEIGEKMGFEWGGRWKMKDYPHFQYTAGLSLEDIKQGNMPDINKVPIIQSERDIFIEDHLGKIFLAKEKHGEVFYINPLTRKAEYMGQNMNDRHKFITKVAIGINNKDLRTALGSEEYEDY